jgi:hypothetical protein
MKHMNETTNQLFLGISRKVLLAIFFITWVVFLKVHVEQIGPKNQEMYKRYPKKNMWS